MKIKCKECGSTDFSERWANKDQIERLQLCQRCCFWQDVIDEYSSGAIIVIEGQVYNVGDETTSRYSKGFDGKCFKIKRKTAEEFITSNLRCIGIVPEIFKDRIIDNALFVGEASNSERDRLKTIR
jgi:hypothetical protein